ncbi:MAG: GlsB/YeaQ/YmgE family stress response membrane protein [Hyphomicrobiaceae bacterium]
MDIVTLVVWLAIGAIAGWLAGQIMKGRSFGLVGDIVVGIVGAVVAGFVLPMIGIHIGGGMLAAIINAVIGACLLLFVLGVMKKQTA